MKLIFIKYKLFHDFLAKQCLHGTALWEPRSAKNDSKLSYRCRTPLNQAHEYLSFTLLMTGNVFFFLQEENIYSTNFLFLNALGWEEKCKVLSLLRPEVLDRIGAL